MPVRYEIDRAQRLVRSVATGTLTDEDLGAHMLSLAADPDFEPSYRQIYDFRGVAELRLTGSELRERRRDNPWTEPTRRAFVCSQEVVYGMARMYQMLTDERPDEIRVFREMRDALEWLGLETPK